MSLRLPIAATRAYDLLKSRPGATPRRSDARDLATLERISGRLRQLVGEYQINGDEGAGGSLYVFWTEVQAQIEKGVFDDLLDGL
ncbi:MAG: hypothetical protein H7Z41_19785 [Cytophagales bacterium]|nr:hypothetical protein [Armatimonadota bacterium]